DRRKGLEFRRVLFRCEQGVRHVGIIKLYPGIGGRPSAIGGWYSYRYGDPAPANALIKRDNPEMTDALLAYGIAKIKEYGIVYSGDAKTNGIGAMTEARWREFFDTMANAGIYPKDLDFHKAFTLQFVDKKVGMRP